MKNPRLILFALIAAFCAVIATGCDKKSATPPGPGGANMPPPQVNVYVATSAPTRLTMDLPGRAAAYRIAEVRPQVNGILQKRLFEEGSLVKAGQVLYQIDPAIYEAALASAEASLEQAQATANSAHSRAERYKVLVKTKAVSDQDLIDADAAWKQAQAAIAAAKAAIKTAKINLDYTKVKAPISGKIGRSLVSEGALVTAQQAGAMAIIQQINPLYVDVSQSSVELLHLKKNLGAEDGKDLASSVKIFLEDNSAYDHDGSLKFSDVAVDPSTSSVTIRATVPNPDQLLLPGMYLRARLTSAKEVPAIAVPQQCIQRDIRAEPQVMLVNDHGIVEARSVVTGQNMGDKVLIVSGLKDGDKVVFAGFQKIKAGLPAKIVDAPPESASGKKTE
ncbi:MAG: efflux RND transporter periplasmic adaptor subunit [Desulfobulbaceae bacterium]|nr:efflux RND transporter periplasmic adaptor subunit [Desulfobulbaceae bacterium]